MAFTTDDFNKIWASNATTPAYTFTDADYLEGWDFVGNLPPTRAQWNAIQKRTDEKMQYLTENFGKPNVANTVADMTDKTKVYVYTGSETGYTAGDWYYWNGSAWADGGVYNAVAVTTDTTLTQAGEPADAKATGDAVKITDSEMSLFGVHDYLWNFATFPDGSTRTINDVTFVADIENKSVSVSGTATGTAIFRFFAEKNSFPNGMVAGGTYVVEINTPLECTIHVYPYIGSSLGSIIASTRGQAIFTIPSNATGLMVRLYMASGDSAVGTVRPLVADAFSLIGLYNGAGSVYHGIVPNNTDLDTIENTGVYYISASNTYTNAPIGGALGFMEVYSSSSATKCQIIRYYMPRRTYIRFKSTNWQAWCTDDNNGIVLSNNADLDTLLDTDTYLLLDSNTYSNAPVENQAFMLYVNKIRGASNYQYVQLAFGFSANDYIYRRSKVGSNSWNAWEVIGGGGGSVYNNTYELNEYSSTNTYNVTPTITTDTHNYLASTGDSTDRKGAIETLLSTNGICHLAPGDFYVSGIDMPPNTELVGCGNKTRIILLGTDTTEGYAVKMASYCTVKDVMIVGNTEDHTSNTAIFSVDSTYYQRHGILWQGNRSGNNDDIKQRGTITNCYICNFTGGGITGYDNGGTVSSGLNISDCTIWYCYAGINFIYWTEFNRVTNVTANNCKYGCVNNGGNNIFTNCGFSNNRIGILMDNSNGQSPNNSHGSFVGCTINHSGSNTGYALQLYGMGNYEMFSACQIFYGKTLIDNCLGIHFIGGCYGRATDIEVTNSTSISFDSCQFRTIADTPVTASGSTVAFNNCVLNDASPFYPI